ncbi:MAG: hypothetical protein IJS99_05595 [Synergistaceae bacterium]|nr:hypothetical protein [Synergistaceae bacterium]
MNKKSIGILYLCTGDYYLCWKGFHESFEKNFLPNTIKNYYVFTDQVENIPEDERVKVYYIDHLPWPLVTLLRFHVFTRFRKEIENNDYLMFANSNLACSQIVTEEEFLPSEEQEISAVICPWAWNTKARYYFAYERDKKSTAYVPYNIEGRYIMAALFCGRTDKFLQMSEILQARINRDLHNKIIAKIDDESYFNRYVLENRNFRILTPAYLYVPLDNMPFENKITVRSKSELFNVNLARGGDSLQ